MARFISRALGAATALTLLAPSAAALAPIVAKGSKFFNSQTGAQWYIKGVAYQLNAYSLDGTDPGQCAIDAALMQTLGANAIRVYHVNPQTNHDECMQAFSDHGIYLFVDLDTFSSTITQTAPQWTPAQYGAFKYVMDAFHKYDNVAGFFVGNEILNTVGPMTNCMPYLKAAAADMKAYRDAAGYRKIPIGYSHADVAGLRPVLQNYLACGNPDQAIDFFGLNAYEWCGQNTFEGSGYAYLLNQTLEYPVPIFMSETGCIVPLPRTFDDQTALLGPQMDGKWSGAIVYEWIQEANHYGIVSYSGITDAFDYSDAGNIRNGTPQPIVPDFANLKNQWATLNPTGVQMAQYTPTETPMACPAYTAGVWEVDPSAALPTLGLNVAIPTSSALALANLGLSGPFTTPNANAIAVTSAVPSTTAAPSSSARQSSSGAASSASSARSSGASAASSASSGAASSASSAASSASSRASSATSGAASAASSATSRASSAAASTTPNAAARVGAGMAAGLVGVAAVML